VQRDLQSGAVHEKKDNDASTLFSISGSARSSMQWQCGYSCFSCNEKQGMTFSTPFWKLVLSGVKVAEEIVVTPKQVKEERQPGAARIKRPRKTDMPVLFRLTEKVNVSELPRIREYMAKNCTRGEITLFESFAKQIDAEGVVEVGYHHTDPNSRGRISAVGSLSLGCVKKNIRAALGHGLYYDVDIKNAHPRILLYIAKKNNWPCHCLEDYIRNRAQHLADLGYPPQINKQIYLSVLYGGSHKSVLEEANYPSHGVTVFCNFLQTEMAKLARLVYKEYTDLHVVCDESMSKHERHVRVLSFVLSEIELNAIKAAFRYLQSHDWTVATIIHDGMLVYKKQDATIDESFLESMSAYVAEDIGVELPFVVKEFEKTDL
jgi:hypothetical protein